MGTPKSSRRGYDQYTMPIQRDIATQCSTRIPVPTGENGFREYLSSLHIPPLAYSYRLIARRQGGTIGGKLVG